VLFVGADGGARNLAPAITLIQNSLRVLGRWMRMVTIPKQSSVPKAYDEFDDNGQMKPSSLDDRLST
jgi:NAD(P)H-dependent FMN reductase